LATILVYDWDYFHYNYVIPNLECAKYAAWRKSKRDIVVSVPILEPTRYTSVFLRKEYDDGIFDKRLLEPNVEYGGRAFSQRYQPFDLEMERAVPDLTIYEKYKDLYGSRRHDEDDIKTILNATHVRLSLDEKTLEPFPYDRLRPRHPSVIFHDYDIAKVPGAFELLTDVSKARQNGLPYRIGNKYPINVYTYEELRKWMTLPPMGTCFYLQYNVIFTDEEIIDLLEHPTMKLQKIVYNFTYGFLNEDQFVVEGLPQIYKQALFLRSHKQKILLNIDTSFFKTRELLLVIKLINCFYGKTSLKFVHPHKQTLFGYCAWNKRVYMEYLPWMRYSVSQQEMREAFQYVRKHNYEVFDMFYSVPNVIPEGGKLVNEWTRNSQSN